MQEQDELDALPQKFKDGILTEKEAAMKMLEIIYMSPGRFNLMDMDEDERSDFLLSSLPRFERLFRRYDKSFGPLGAYLFYSIPGIKSSWLRMKADKTTERRAMMPCVKKLYEDAAVKSGLLVAEPAEIKNRGKISREEKCEPQLVFRRIFARRENFLEPKELFYKKRAALTLALKSAWYIDDKAAEKVSGFCGFPLDSVLQTLDKVKNGLLEKSAARADMQERRDRAWYFVCKYRERLFGLDPANPKYKVLKRKLDFQMNVWKKKNRLLQSGQMSLAPRNKDLAKLLKIKPYRIGVYLNYAKKMAEAGETIFDSDSSSLDIKA